MVNDNGFNLKDLVPAASNPASEAPLRGQLPAELEKPKIEFDVMTLENPRALINLFPQGYRAILLETINSPDNKEAFDLYMAGQEQKLDKKVSPSKIDHALRYSLWTTYFNALETGAPVLQINRVYAGITTAATFDKVIRGLRAFWLLLPPTDYQLANRRAHERALDRLHQILEIDPAPEGGKINTALINLQLKIYALLDARLNGAITHKHEITTKNVHLGITADQVQKLYQQTQQEVNKLAVDPVLRNEDIIEIETHQRDYKK